VTAVTDAATPSTPDVETAIATDMVKRALPIAPAIVLVAALFAGSKGAWTALLAVAIVIVNFLLAAISLSWAARTSPVTLMAMSLGGFLVRMGLVTAVVLAVRHASWINLSVLAITILVTQLGLLFWETKYVGASLAFPGVKPK